MNYMNHNLRTDLQEWKNRLYRSNSEQFSNQIKYFFDNLNSNKQLLGLLQEVIISYSQKDRNFDEIIKRSNKKLGIQFEDLADQASFCYQFLKYFILKHDSYELMKYNFFRRGDYHDSMQRTIDNYISPIVQYLHDKLDKSNAIIFLLEKYKKRTEWFTHKSLLAQYQNTNKNYEQIFEDDLRLFLFDQGIDYPFSTPSSPSGRADVIGNLDTDDPLVVEIKVFDQKKNYGKNRIKDGFHQVVKYTNDFNKDVGYLVVYNMDAVEIHLNFSEKSNTFPPSIHFNNKVYYFVIINLNQNVSASKAGKLKELEVTEADLIAVGE